MRRERFIAFAEIFTKNTLTSASERAHTHSYRTEWPGCCRGLHSSSRSNTKKLIEQKQATGATRTGYKMKFALKHTGVGVTLSTKSPIHFLFFLYFSLPLSFLVCSDVVTHAPQADLRIALPPPAPPAPLPPSAAMPAKYEKRPTFQSDVLPCMLTAIFFFRPPASPFRKRPPY